MSTEENPDNTHDETVIAKRRDTIDEATAIAAQLAHHAPGADAQTLAENIRAGLWHHVAGEIVRAAETRVLEVVNDMLVGAGAPMDELTTIGGVMWLARRLAEVTKQRDEGTVEMENATELMRRANQAIADDAAWRRALDRIQLVVGLHTEHVTCDMVVEAVTEAVCVAEALEVDVAMLEQHIEDLGWLGDVWEGLDFGPNFHENEL